MKYCHECGRLFKNEFKECAHDGTLLTDINEAFSTHKKPDPVTSIEDLPYVDEAVNPHDDWATWKARELEPIRTRTSVDEPLRESKPEQRRQLTSMGVVFGVIGFLLHALTGLPAAQAAVVTEHLGSATVEETTPTTSSSEVVIVTKTGTVVQRMSSMSPQELRSSQRPQDAQSGNIKVARNGSQRAGNLSTPTAR